MTDDDLNPWLKEQLERTDLSVDSAPTLEQWQDFLGGLDSDLGDSDGRAVILGEDVERLISKTADAFFLHDTSGALLEVNDAACAMLGYEREELLDMNVVDFELHVRSDATWEDTTVGTIQTVEGEHVRKDGSTYPVEVRLSALESGGEKFILAFCRDISRREEQARELRQTNARLEAARDEAVRANKAKSTFLANVSHELRTPLNAVIGYSEMLMDEMKRVGDEQYRSDLVRIRTAGEQLLAIINDVLDLSKIEAGKMELHLEYVDVGSLLEDIEVTVRPLADKNDNELALESDKSIELRTDPTKCRQILFNLLSNACKFTKDGRVELMVGATQIDGGPAVHFRVEDTGIGMSEDEIGRVFGAFQQADSSTTRAYGGTGLGLAITQRFTDMLGGTISVTSEKGMGTTVDVVIPSIEDGLDVSTVPDPEPLRGFAPIHGEPGKTTVLVVEDDADARDLLRRALEADGYDVVTASSGREGLLRAREIEPDIITLDVMMPTLDGWTVLALVRKNPKLRDIPVVLISMLDEKQKGLALGADHYMSKPVDRDRLRAILASYARDKDLRRVLVVDDDDAARELVRRSLEGPSWEIREAENGRDAIEVVDEWPPDLVILDLMMPEMDGFAFLSDFRKDSRFEDVPVLVVTAKDLTREDYERLREGASGILAKAGRSKAGFVENLREMIDGLASDDGGE